MKIRLSFIFLFCVFSAAQSQNTIGTKKTLIPSGWTLFKEAVGDLNKDSIDDAAIIIENTVPNSEGEKQRALLILLKNNKTDNSYMQIARGDHVILGSESGGLLGDSFSLMEIKRNVLRIDFSGGSRQQWTTTHRYRYQQGGFVAVIGATYKIEADAVTEIYDYNISNGKIIVTKTDATNKAKNVTRNQLHKMTTPELSRFAPEAVWAILMPKDYAKVSTCVFQEVGLGDCAHIIFDCGDFGNAETYLDQASEDLFRDLITETDPGDMQANPKYVGKTFEITYAEKKGIRCEPEGEATYQLLVGFKLKN